MSSSCVPGSTRTELVVSSSDSTIMETTLTGLRALPGVGDNDVDGVMMDAESVRPAKGRGVKAIEDSVCNNKTLNAVVNTRIVVGSMIQWQV